MKNIKNFFRLVNIIYILIKHNATLPLAKFKIFKPIIWLRSKFSSKKISQGEAIAEALEELGPIFVKLGQAFSSRPDFVGPEIADKLAKLRDKISQFEFIKVQNIILEQFSEPIENLFLSFSEDPVAAASVAQVHKAITKDNKVVAVKILRPEIDKAFAKDLDLMFWIAKLIDKYFSKYKRLKIIEVINNFKENIKVELDLRMEAAASSELKENNKDEKVYIPKVYWELTSEKVFTSEWIEGISIYDDKKLREAGFDLKELATIFARMFFEQAFNNGTFHADLHPGNIFVNNEGKIVLVDFGIIGRITKKERIFVAEILYGFLKRDYNRVAELHFEAGYVPQNKSIFLFAQSCRAIGEPIIGLPINKVSLAKLLSLLFKITEDFEMPTQPQLLLLQKTMVLVEGVGASLDPNTNMWKLAEPWIEDWAIKNLGIEVRIKDSLKNLLMKCIS